MAPLRVSAHGQVRRAASLADVIARNPLRTEPENPARFFVAFLPARIDRSAAAEIEQRSCGDGSVWISAAEAYLWCPGGFSLLGLTKMIEERCGLAATTRNWNTVTGLAQLAGS